MKERNPYYLPQNVEPLHYEIALQPDLTRFTFSGSEKVLLQLHKATTQVTLHALDLKIKDAHIRSPLQSEPQKARRIRWNKKKETITIDFGKTLKRGSAELFLEFEGELNDKMNGFYRTS